MELLPKTTPFLFHRFIFIQQHLSEIGKRLAVQGLMQTCVRIQVFNTNHIKPIALEANLFAAQQQLSLGPVSKPAADKGELHLSQFDEPVLKQALGPSCRKRKKREAFSLSISHMSFVDTILVFTNPECNFMTISRWTQKLLVGHLLCSWA